MEIFTTLIARILPLYAIIVLGFIAGRYLHVQKESIARLLIYIIAPVVTLYSAATVEISLSTMLLPVVGFLFACSMSLMAYFTARKFWSGSIINLFSYAAGVGNTGYFGLPVAIALFGPDIGLLMIIGGLGSVLFESTLGFFITARGTHTVRESVIKLVRLPSLYAFIAGITLNLLELRAGPELIDLATLFKGAFTVLGMMLIGLGLASIQKFKLDFQFLTATIVMRFVIWPVAMAAFLHLDASVLHIFSTDSRHILTLISIVPLAANTVAYATELRVHPDKAATAVLASTLIALVFIPLFAALTGIA